MEELVKELRSYPAHYTAAHRAADTIERMAGHIAQQQLDIVTLGQEVGGLRGAIMQCETIVRQFQLENEERGKSAISNNARLKYRAVAARSGVLLCSVKKIARAALGEEKP